MLVWLEITQEIWAETMNIKDQVILGVGLWKTNVGKGNHDRNVTLSEESDSITIENFWSVYSPKLKKTSLYQTKASETRSVGWNPKIRADGNPEIRAQKNPDIWAQGNRSELIGGRRPTNSVIRPSDQIWSPCTLHFNLQHTRRFISLLTVPWPRSIS